MSAPPFVAEFDSSTGLVRALSASLAHKPYLRLGRSRPAAAAVRASRALPVALRAAVIARAGAFEGIKPTELPEVEPDRFCRWVTDQYGRRQQDAVAIGSSNGAVAHLCAAMGIPWLPQTFLVPVRRRADPDDCLGDTSLAAEESEALLASQPALAIHQMHDPNQDRLMVRHIAYFRMKMRALSSAYRRYLRQTLPPGGTILIVEGCVRWPVTRRGERHVYQHGAVGGLGPDEYDRRWRFPSVVEWAPEAEWGYDAALTSDVLAFAARHGYRVARLAIDSPDAAGPVVADIYREWYAATGRPSRRLLVETFICEEAGWALATRTVPLWLTFGTEPSLDVFAKYLCDSVSSNARPFNEIAITLFPHGVRSAGYAAADRWRQVAHDHGVNPTLAGVDTVAWPVDFSGLATYAGDLHRSVPPDSYPKPLSLIDAAVEVARFGPAHGVRWTWE
ncbi:MAG: hypothetical protein ACTHK4_09485 [Mycobacteriales bacterium]